MLKNILTGNVVIGYVFDKISISDDREKNIPRCIRITLVSDVIPVSYTHLDVYKRQAGMEPVF